MPTNIKFELLELLANDYPNWVNVRPLINKHRLENNFTRQDFSTLLYSLQDKKFIRTQNVVALSYHKQDVYDDESDITAKLEPDGLDEYHKLKNIYSPQPTSVTNNTINADKNKGSIIQSSSDINRLNFDQSTPIINPDNPKQNITNKVGKFLIKNSIALIIAILAIIIGTWACIKFGWLH